MLIEEINCTVLSPMFMHGIKQKKDPVIRATGLKAAMRFWWRAARQATNEDTLRREEMSLFGGTEEGVGRSSYSLRVSRGARPDDSHLDKMSIMPHHTTNTCSPSRQSCRFTNNRCQKQNQYPCICEGYRFTTSISARRQNQLDRAFTVFELSSLLGGVGQRNRRGFGAYTTGIFNTRPDESIEARIIRLLNSFSDQVEYSESTIGTNDYVTIESSSETRSDFLYPSIHSIYIRQTNHSVRKLLRVIGQATHDVKGTHRRNYSQACGDGRPRLASPVYITLAEHDGNNYMVITLLRSPDTTGHLATQQALIKEVLNNV